MAKQHRGIELPSDRSFGWTFTVVFLIVTAWAVWRGHGWWTWTAGIAGAFALCAAIVPALLHPLNVVWMKFGLLLHRIVNPVVLGAIYFLVFTPVALAMRAAGRDALLRRLEPDRRSYWVERDPPGPKVENFPQQF